MGFMRPLIAVAAMLVLTGCSATAPLKDQDTSRHSCELMSLSENSIVRQVAVATMGSEASSIDVYEITGTVAETGSTWHAVASRGYDPLMIVAPGDGNAEYSLRYMDVPWRTEGIGEGETVPDAPAVMDALMECVGG